MIAACSAGLSLSIVLSTGRSWVFSSEFVNVRNLYTTFLRYSILAIDFSRSWFLSSLIEIGKINLSKLVNFFFKALRLAHLRISSFSTFIWSESREFVDSLSLRSSFKCESCNFPLSMSVLRSSICWIRSLDSCWCWELWFWWLEVILEDNGDSLRSSSIVLLLACLFSSRLRSIFYCANNKG